MSHLTNRAEKDLLMELLILRGPMSATQLADATGLTPVQVGGRMRSLYNEGRARRSGRKAARRWEAVR